LPSEILKLGIEEFQQNLIIAQEGVLNHERLSKENAEKAKRMRKRR